MSIGNLYADLDDFRGRFVNNATLDSYDQTQILKILEESSRRVDGYCHGWFYTSHETRVFDGPGRDPTNTDYLNWASRNIYLKAFSFLRIPWLVAGTTVALDQDGDRTFETVLDPTKDYYLLQDWADNEDLPPFNTLQLDIFNGSVTLFSNRPRLVQIVGTWGYGSDTTPLGLTGTLADSTTAQLSTSASGDLAVGQTLAIEGEQVYLTAGAGTNWTVLRGQNGSTAAAHTGAALSRYVYTPAAREATLITAGRAWQRRKTSFANLIVNVGVDSIEVVKGLDPDVAEILSNYKRVVI